MKLTIQVIDDAGNVFAGEAVLDRLSGNGEVRARRDSKAGQRTPRKISCSYVVERLWEKGKFKQALSFKSVKAALAEEGCNFPLNTVMMALQNAEFLTRHGARGSYAWTQRYPFRS